MFEHPTVAKSKQISETYIICRNLHITQLWLKLKALAAISSQQYAYRQA